MSAEGSTRAIVAALAANVGIAVSKFVAFAITGSSSMLAEGVHSVVDSGNQVLLLIGGQRSKRRPTPSTRSATVPTGSSTPSSSRSCCSASARCSPCTRASRRSCTRTRWRAPRWPSWCSLVAIVLESLSFRTAMREAQHICVPEARGSTSSGTPRTLSCQWFCSRTAVRWSAWGWR